VRPKRNPEIVWRLEEGMRQLAWERARKGEGYEDLGVLTLLVQGAIHQLNLVGAEVWTRINGINTAEKIARDVAALFESDTEEMEQEVGEFLHGLGEKGWVILDASQAPQGPLWRTS
jgi:GeoRSP system PqqD family protein